MSEQVIPIWIPVGIPLGYTYYAELDVDDPEAREMSQKFGKKYLSLPSATYFVWDSAFDRHDRDGIAELARSRLVPDPERRFDELVEEGGLVNINGDFEYVSGFMSYFRLIPAAVGLGNDRINMYQYRLGLPHQPRVEIDHATYRVWSESNAQPTLLDACKKVAEDQDDKLEDVITVITMQLPALLTARVVFVDAVV